VFPALALGVGEGDEALMRQPPRRASEAILTRDHWLEVVGYGVLIAAVLMPRVLAAGWPAARVRLLIWQCQKSRLEYAGSRYYHVDKPREKREMTEG
jgi:hypothetical protein